MIVEVICECLMLAKGLTFCAVVDVTEVLVRLVKFNVRERKPHPTPLLKGHCKNRPIITI